MALLTMAADIYGDNSPKLGKLHLANRLLTACRH
jgi:hypothetical protein